MIKKFKQWVINTFLPAYAKEIYAEIKEENKQLRHELELKEAYIDGLEMGLRKIKIINNVGGDK